MIGWRQQVVGDQRVEEVLGRQARCPKNVIAKFLQYSFTTTCSNIDWLITTHAMPTQDARTSTIKSMLKAEMVETSKNGASRV